MTIMVFHENMRYCINITYITIQTFTSG